MRNGEAKNFFATIGVLFCVMIVYLHACTTTPKSPREQIATAYTTVTSVRLGAAQLLQRDRITISEAQRVQLGADEARDALDIASAALIESDLDTMDAKLKLAQSILVELENYLKSKE